VVSGDNNECEGRNRWNLVNPLDSLLNSMFKAEKAMAQARESSPFLLRRRKSQFTPAGTLVETPIRESQEPPAGVSIKKDGSALKIKVLLKCSSS